MNRDRILELLIESKRALETEDWSPRTREMDIIITKLEEAIMWREVDFRNKCKIRNNENDDGAMTNDEFIFHEKKRCPKCRSLDIQPGPPTTTSDYIYTECLSCNSCWYPLDDGYSGLSMTHPVRGRYY